MGVMSRVTAALIVVLLAASPVAGVALRAGGHGGNPCCAEANTHCGDPTPRLRCCAPPSEASPIAPPPQIASPSSGRDVPAAEIAAPPVPASLVAVIASRTYTSRQGLDIHAPPYLQHCVFLI